MIKNIIFDFGNVLISFVPEYMARFAGNKEDIQLVADVIFDRKYWNLLDSGDITDEQVKADALKRLPERLHEVAEKCYDEWIYNIPELGDMFSVVREMKKRGYGVYLLSNISRYFAENIDCCEIISEFDGIVLSAVAGYVKPQKGIFNLILNKYSLKGEECLFIDDSPVNIDGAAKCGINTYLFDGDCEKLKTRLYGNL